MFQYHLNAITIIQYFKMLLNCNSSLRVPSLPAYDLSNFDVVLLLFTILASLHSNLTTASLFLYNLGGIEKYCKTLRMSWLYDSLP